MHFLVVEKHFFIFYNWYRWSFFNKIVYLWECYYEKDKGFG